MQSRSEWVDYAKAIGILLVVYGHVARGLYNAGLEVNNHLYALADSFVYSFHMPLFFFLSGLFFLNSIQRRGGGKLILSKIDTVFYPYIVWSILQGSIEVVMSKYTNGNVSLVEVLSLLWAPRAQFWFLYALFVIFCLVSLLYTISKNKDFSLAVLALSALAYVYQSLLPDNLLIGFISNNLVFFMFGIVFSIYFNNRLLSGRLLLFLSALLFFSAQYFFHIVLALNYVDKGLASMLLALISITFIIFLSIWLSKTSSKFIVLIGSSSMAIYLMHVILGSGIRVVLKKALGVDSFVTHAVVGCFFGLLGPVMALLITKRFDIKYVFTAPISGLLSRIYKKINIGNN